MVKIRFSCGHQQDCQTSQRPVCRVCGDTRVSHVLARSPTVTHFDINGHPVAAPVKGD